MSVAQTIGRDLNHRVGGLLTASLCLTPVALLSLGSFVDPLWFWPALM